MRSSTATNISLTAMLFLSDKRDDGEGGKGKAKKVFSFPFPSPLKNFTWWSTVAAEYTETGLVLRI